MVCKIAKVNLGPIMAGLLNIQSYVNDLAWALGEVLFVKESSFFIARLTIKIVVIFVLPEPIVCMT